MVSLQADRIAEGFRPNLTLVPRTAPDLLEITQAEVVHDICVPSDWKAGVLPQQFRNDEGLAIPNLIKLREKEELLVPSIFRGFIFAPTLNELLTYAKKYPGSTLVAFAHEGFVTDRVDILRQGFIPIPHYKKIEDRKIEKEKISLLHRPRMLLIVGTDSERPSLQQSSPAKGEIVFNIVNGAGIPLPI